VVIDDPLPPLNPAKIIMCSGKIAYELMNKRKDKKIKDTVIIRLEQLYPFPFDQLSALLKKYHSAKVIRWVQEEPRNMGGWNFTLARMREILPKNRSLEYVGRLPSASPATGIQQMHTTELELMLRQAFA
jgi:2-oxoglutarate dehydrogenase complex dehydrogenase (E1) component-like enzyme